MLYRPFDNLQNNDFTENLRHSTLDEHRQHGIHQHQQPQQQYLSLDGHTLPVGQERKRSILLDVPPETLTSITSYLTPPALLSLGCVSSYLAHHVREDNTWRRAFVCHFLGISPEADINIGNRSEGLNQIATGYDLPSVNPWKTLLLRRVDGKSWRDEFAWRYVMINRWKRSKSTTITHIPIIHSTISSLHLMNIPSPAHSSTTAATSFSSAGPASSPTPYIYPSTRFAAPALLCASNQYGIVARSLPLSGKVLTGYLDASTGAARLGGGAGNNNNFGWANMNGNGNPNAQFTPNVTASDVTSSVPPSSSSQGEVPSGHHPMLATAHVVWGTSTGEVIFTTAPRVMNANVNDGRGGRTGRAGAGAGAEVRRCRLGDEHEGAVRDVKWVFGGGGETTTTTATTHTQAQKEQPGRWAVSAGSDGRVKLWDAESAVCLWSSDVMRDRGRGRERVGGLPDPLGKVDAFFGFPSLRPNPNPDDSNNSNSKSTSGMVVAVGESGDVYVWVGLDIPNDGNTVDGSNVKTVVVDCPSQPSTFYSDSVSINTGRNHHNTAIKVSALAIDPNFEERSGEGGRMRVDVNVSFLVAYEGDSLFYRVSVGLGLGVGVNDDDDDQVDLEVTPFGNPEFGATSVVKAYFGRRGFGCGFREGSFVLVGDRVGCVGVYDWDDIGHGHGHGHSRAGAAETSATWTSSTSTSTSTSTKRTTGTSTVPIPIPPLKTFEAHRDGASVTALWWDGHVLVTGSARGTTHVWDGIKFSADGHLRSFVSPVKRVRGARGGGGGDGNGIHAEEEREREREMVKHIVVNRERDVIVVVVGDTVMAWHAGVARGGRGAGGGKGGVRGRHAPGTGVGKKRVGGGGAKVIGEYEMRRTILESRDLLELDNGTTTTGRGYYERAHAREREQREGLEVLGLSEGEAVEYALMLSRDEAVALAAERARAMVEAPEEGERGEPEEGVFEGEFDDEGDEEYEDASVYGVSVSPSVSSSSSSASLVSSVSVSASASASNSSLSLSMSTSRSGGSVARRMGLPIMPSRHHDRDRDRVRVGPSPSASNEKVQISPPYPYRSEVKEAGEEYVDVDVDVDGVGGGGRDVGLELESELEESHFPPIPGSAGANSPRKGKDEAEGVHRRRGDHVGAGAGEEGEEDANAEMARGKGKGKGKGKAKAKAAEKGKKNKKASASSSSSGGVNANTNMNANSNPNPNTNSTTPSRVPVASASVGAAAGATATTTTAAAGSSTPGGSPTHTSSKANAWSVPLKPKAFVSSASPASRDRANGSSSSSGHGHGHGFGVGGPGRGGGGDDEGDEGDSMDEDLRFALELSLVEARSRGEDV